MHVGVCRFTLLVPGSHSLKDRRASVRRLRDRVRQRFQIGLVEVGGQDTWQRADLAFSVLTGSRDAAEAAVAQVLRFVQDQGQGSVAAARSEVTSFGDDWYADAAPVRIDAPAGDGDWVPAEWLAVDEAAGDGGDGG